MIPLLKPVAYAAVSIIPPHPDNKFATIERFELTFPYGQLLWRTPSSPSNQNHKFFSKVLSKTLTEAPPGAGIPLPRHIVVYCLTWHLNQSDLSKTVSFANIQTFFKT
jgi:hypothetical protein